MAKETEKRLIKTIEFLKEPQGSTIPTIVKAINVDGPQLSLKRIVQTLKGCMENGMVQLAAGRVKLKQVDMMAEAKPDSRDKGKDSLLDQCGHPKSGCVKPNSPPGPKSCPKTKGSKPMSIASKSSSKPCPKSAPKPPSKFCPKACPKLGPKPMIGANGNVAGNGNPNMPNANGTGDENAASGEKCKPRRKPRCKPSKPKRCPKPRKKRKPKCAKPRKPKKSKKCAPRRKIMPYCKKKTRSMERK